jgi:anti-sigma regulatory factor (Ser/Thr protein kinase)
VNIDSAACKLLFSDPISTESAGILLRSRLQSVGRRLGFTDGRRENMALVASEMATNLIKHAAGKGMLQIWEQPGGVLDLVSFDYGPGVDNLSLAQQDGFSTTRTLGKGLGSMQRLSDQFAIFSRQAKDNDNGHWHGTVIWCRFQQQAQPGTTPAAAEIGLFVRSLSDDRHNGDHIYVNGAAQRLRLFHLDGLGHGESAELATAHLDSYVSQASDLNHLVQTVDRHLRTTTRGAVAIACELDLASRTLRMLGVGDMATHLCQRGRVQHFSFAPGVLGREHKTPHPTEVELEPGATLISTSDGIRRGWDENSFPGLCNHHPQLVAYVIGNSMARMTDDQSVCALKLN